MQLATSGHFGWLLAYDFMPFREVTPATATSTGEVIDVEPGEAEWNLDTLERLFDFHFVQPARLAKKETR